MLGLKTQHPSVPQIDQRGTLIYLRYSFVGVRCPAPTYTHPIVPHSMAVGIPYRGMGLGVERDGHPPSHNQVGAVLVPLWGYQWRRRYRVWPLGQLGCVRGF